MTQEKSLGLRWRHVVLTLVACVLMLGANPRASAAADHIKIGAVRSLGGAPAYFAKEKGWFDAEGLDAEIVFFDWRSPLRWRSPRAMSISAPPD